MADANLYSENFQIDDVNPLKYDRVVRVQGHSDNHDTTIALDVNSELFPCTTSDRLQLLLTSTLSLDGSKDDGKGWRDVGRGETTMADDYDYVCHGKIYRFEEARNGEVMKVFVSFGGLLLLIDGPYKTLSGLRQDHIYLCLKK